MAKFTYGLIGHPVGHSLSPAMHNSAFKALKIDAEYKLFDVPPEGLEKFLKNIPKEGISGANVTIPHKVKAKEYIQKHGDLNENAKKLGAVNTIKVIGQKLAGYNTDGPGFYRSLIEDLRFEPEGKTIFVLGAGGAARAIVMYLGSSPKKIYVSDIEKSAADEVKKQFGQYYDPMKVEAVDVLSLKKYSRDIDLLIQATPIGMKDGDPSPVDLSLLDSNIKIYDLVYNRPATKLVEEASRMKINAVTGLGMLLYQGVIAFELWTGKKAPVDVMRMALKESIVNSP